MLVERERFVLFTNGCGGSTNFIVLRGLGRGLPTLRVDDRRAMRDAPVAVTSALEN